MQPQRTPPDLGAEASGSTLRLLTESVLYTFLPMALNVMLPNRDDPADSTGELDSYRCRVSHAWAADSTALQCRHAGK